MMLFGLKKVPLIFDLFLVRCNCLLLHLQIDDANESCEQLIDYAYFLIEGLLNVVPDFAGE